MNREDKIFNKLFERMSEKHLSWLKDIENCAIKKGMDEKRNNYIKKLEKEEEKSYNNNEYQLQFTFGSLEHQIENFIDSFSESDQKLKKIDLASAFSEGYACAINDINKKISSVISDNFFDEMTFNVYKIFKEIESRELEKIKGVNK